MILFEPYIPTPRESYEEDLWIKSECYRFYVRERRHNCTFREIMNLWLRVPYCCTCAVSEPLTEYHAADITGRNWRRDVAWTLGNETLGIIKTELRRNSDFALICKHCRTELRPWKGDEVWVVNDHIEEHYQIPLETPGRKSVSSKVRKKIIELYDRACFGCGATNTTNKKLHIDHILPQSKGGDSAFRNLQPLCKDCGNLKGDELPEEVDVYSDIYFGVYPLDGYAGLFW